MASKAAKTASLLVPSSEESRGSLQEFLNGNTAVHAERGVNFTRVVQLAALNLLSICWREKAGVISETEVLIGPSASCSLYLTDLKRTEPAMNYNLPQLSGRFFLVFREQPVHVCVDKQLLPEPTMREIWENIPKIQTELNMRL